MWILLTDKPPTEVAPPALSIMWATPWPMRRDGEDFRSKEWRAVKKYDSHGKFDEYGFGFEPNVRDAVRIRFAGEDIRLFPHEFIVLSEENLQAYVKESHDLVTDTEAEEKLLAGLDESIFYMRQRGFTKRQAMTTLLTGLVTENDDWMGVPPIGWYRVRPEFGLYFKDEEDLMPRLRKPEEEEI